MTTAQKLYEKTARENLPVYTATSEQGHSPISEAKIGKLLRESKKLIDKLDYLFRQEKYPQLSAFKDISEELLADLRHQIGGFIREMAAKGQHTQVFRESAIFPQWLKTADMVALNSHDPINVRRELWNHYKLMLQALEAIRREAKSNCQWDLLWLIDEQRQCYHKQRLDMAIATRQMT